MSQASRREGEAMAEGNAPLRMAEKRLRRNRTKRAASPRARAEPPTTPDALNSADPTDAFDRRLRGLAARRLGGSSPWAAAQAWADWAYHLSLSPGRLLKLSLLAAEEARALAAFAVGGNGEPEPHHPDQQDRRFRDPAWSRMPYANLAQAQLAAEAWWAAATAALPGVGAHHMRRVRFLGRHALNAFSPANFAWSNPQVLAKAFETGGQSLKDGAANWFDDVQRLAAGQRFFGAEDHAVGRDMAPTPGRVVLRTDLFELIQYAPQTEAVRREPILIVPAWIMKYYILDLTAEESLIGYLVRQGFTVFCISWRNPGPDDHELTLHDYGFRGVARAIDAVAAIIPGEKIHAVGYCLGGTILAIVAAAQDRDDDHRLGTLSLLAAQTDFSEAGELMMFIDESQLALLEDMMSVQGVLDARQMAGAFYALRANDLYWSRIVERYLIGVRRPATALDAWLADATRMPARMHSQYLRWLFLENRFAQGKLRVGGRAAALKDLHLPIFALGAERDHIAPWRSVHKIALFAGAETTFVLSGGGHNSAVVSPPGKPGAYFRLHRIGSCDDYKDPDVFAAETPTREGSWWPEWVSWLGGRGTIDRVAPPAMGAPESGYPAGEAAPGRYVLEP
jgi:polyhydroxyalkanoate synthase